MSNVKVIIVGLGSIGQRHARNLLSLYNDLELIAFRNAAERAKNVDAVKEFYVLEQALKEKPLAAIISNPTSLHVKTAVKLAQEGVNLFIEKPISNSLAGIDSLMQLSKKKDLTVMVGYCLRFHPIIQKAKSIIDEGKLGKILFAHISVGQYLPDWHPKADYRRSYSAKKSFGGGVVLDLSHEIDYTHWFFGEVQDVNADISKISNLEIETEDYAEILLSFKNGVHAEVHLDYLQKVPTRTGLIVGEDGYLKFDINNGSLEFNSKCDNFKIQEAFEGNEMYKLEMKHFMDCITEKKTPLINLIEGIKTLKIALAAKESSLSGRRISLKSDSQ